LLPHWNEINQVALLPRVLLSHLQLDGLIRMRKSCKQRTHGFTHLEVDRPVLNLHDNVVVKISIQGMKVVVAGAGAIRLSILPIEMIVVYKSAIQNHSAMRLQSTSDYVSRVGLGASILRRPNPSFGIRLDHDAAEVRN